MHCLLRKRVNLARHIIGRIKVAVAFLVHVPSDELLRDHILQSALVVITKIFNDDQLSELLIKSHTCDDVLDFF